MRKKYVTAATLAGSLLTGGVIGALYFAPGPVGADNSTSSTTPTTEAPAGSNTAPAAGTAPTSNEETTHEAGEPADREAAENSGRGFGGGHDGHFGSNEDPTHETSESSAREAGENARATNNPAPTTTTTTGQPGA